MVQGTPMSIHHVDVTIPKVSMPVRDDYQMSDKYDKSELPEKRVKLAGGCNWRTATQLTGRARRLREIYEQTVKCSFVTNTLFYIFC